MPSPTQDLYSTLEVIFHHFNKELFNNTLPNVMFTVNRKVSCMGYFSADRWRSTNSESCHEISVNPSYISNNSLIDVLQTLVHEMVHEWQRCHGTTSRNGYHNKEWAEKMESIGLMPSDTGREGGKKTGQNMSDYPLKNGLFIHSCIALIKNKGLKIPWIDRYSSATKTPQSLSVSELISEPDGDEAGAIESLVSSVNELISLDESESIPYTNQSSFKQKYSCSGCLANVWGKRGLKLVCGECGVEYDST